MLQQQQQQKSLHIKLFMDSLQCSYPSGNDLKDRQNSNNTNINTLHTCAYICTCVSIYLYATKSVIPTTHLKKIYSYDNSGGGFCLITCCVLAFKASHGNHIEFCAGSPQK